MQLYEELTQTHLGLFGQITAKYPTTQQNHLNQFIQKAKQNYLNKVAVAVVEYRRVFSYIIFLCKFYNQASSLVSSNIC